MAILKEAFIHALKRKFKSEDNFDITINPDKGDFEIYHTRTVVEDGAVEDDASEISLSEARQIEEDFDIGEEVIEPVEIAKLDRRTISTLRQTIASKLTDFENQNKFATFEKRIGQIINAEVYYFRNREITLRDENENELTLPHENLIPSEYKPRKGDVIKAVIHKVEMRNNTPFIILSRTSPVFLSKLFEDEVPEITDGLIMIKKAVRVPGEKAKICVDSFDDRIDPVGSCVGVKGSRIRQVVKELNNENIDVIQYTTNLKLFIRRALSPAEILKVEIDEEKRSAKVYVDAEQVPKAIGRNGYNIRLASQITDYHIDVYREHTNDDGDMELSDFEGEIDKWVIDVLVDMGCDTAKSVLELSRNELIRRSDLEEETIDEVITVLNSKLD